MKKTLLFLMLSVSTLFVQAQIPNAGFENWTDGEPDEYITLNILLSLVGKANVTQTTDKHSGSSAIKLETIEYTQFLSTVKDTVAGFAALGTLETQTAGVPFSTRPNSFSGFYKSTLSKQDTAFIVAALFKWNENTKQQDSIGGAIFFTISSVDTYTPFTVPFFYTSSTANPDTIVVLLASSGSRPIPGSTLFVDDLSLSGVTGAKSPLFTNYTPAFPNPAREQLHLNNIPSSAASVEIRDLTGRLIEVLSAQENVNVNVNNYTSGLYQYTVKTVNNTVLYNDKFSVVK